MLTVATSITDGWNAALKAGAAAATMRITIQKMSVALINYDLSKLNSTSLQGTGQFACMALGQSSRPIELGNIKTCSWNRATSQFCASGTLVLTNNKSLGVGVLSDTDEFERPGIWTFGRGDTAESFSRWGHTQTEQNGVLVPDRIIRVYQGYGADYSSAPEQDENLVCLFTGLIDTVTINTDKSVNITFRDMGRALMDTIAWPDVVPFSQYPLVFDTYQQIDGTPITEATTVGRWVHPVYDTDSNKPYVGKGIRDGGRAYVDSDGGINGHIGKHAFDSSTSSYWMSVGNRKRWPSAYEYVQGKFTTASISKVRVTAYGGPYTVYVSVYSGGQWQGNHKIPYRSQEVDTNADIKFIKTAHIGKGQTLDIGLPKVYSGVTKIRVTFADLWDSGIGKYTYRAGCRDLQVFGSVTEPTYYVPKIWIGNVKDYTDCVRWLLSWGGFHWPTDATGFSFVTQSDGTKVNYTHVDSDGGFLPTGRVWGDLMNTGTAPLPLSPLKAEQFALQPLSSCLQFIQNIIGFNLFFDEVGGAVWRLQNIYQQGNYNSGDFGGPNTGYTSDYITIDENTTLLGLSTVISAENVRERDMVGNFTGKYGAINEGENPYPSGLRRYAVNTDQYFTSQDEVKIMADLTSLKRRMTYRQSTITIAANPAIQIDDQVKIYEKITSDTNFHYVTGIQSDFDVSTGKWTYTLTTQCLGTDPNNRDWIVQHDLLDPLTQSYIKKLGGF